MSRLLLRFFSLIVAVVVLVAPSTAQAHPLGNFTVNHYSRIAPAADGVRIFYVLDLAEIPAFQERARIDADQDGQSTESEREQYADARVDELRRNLHITLDDAPADLRVLARSLSFPPGQGGLETLRLEATFQVSIPSAGDRSIRLTYRDDNDPGRIGWREIVARPGTSGTRIEQATVPADDQSDELRVYPADLLSSPPDVRQARLTFIPGTERQNTVERAPSALVERGTDLYAALATVEKLSPSVLLLSLATALVLGAVHALSPGHGKTIVAAYLVGSRGTARHAMLLGATVTITHTIGVYALGLVTLYLSQYVLPERLYPILEVISGLLVVMIGGGLLAGRLRNAVAGHHRSRLELHWHQQPHADAHTHTNGHAHGHQHEHQHGGSTHSHLPPGADGQPVTWRSLLALGVSGGLLPCPSALVVLLSAIALHRVAFGLLLIVAFSLGLAGVLVGLGLLLVYARDRLQRLSIGGGLATRLLPVVSALFVVVAGLVITIQALPRLL